MHNQVSIKVYNYSIRVKYKSIDAHRGGVRGGKVGEWNNTPPRQILKKLVNKNVIKRKIGVPPLAIFPETLDPP
jgi:hypothetical protein